MLPKRRHETVGSTGLSSCKIPFSKLFSNIVSFVSYPFVLRKCIESMIRYVKFFHTVTLPRNIGLTNVQGESIRNTV